MLALATRMATGAQTACDLLCIDIGAERFALPLASVEEMVDASGVELTANIGHHQHRHMVGVIRLRHELVPAYDAVRVLNVARTSAAPLALVLEGSGKLLVLLVDGAEAAPQVNLAELRTPERLMSMDHVLDGVLMVNQRWVGLLNTAALVEALERDVGEPATEARNG